ncbi:MAG: nitrate reductase subunit alpha [Gammaproteobacteria bacterium]|uniref:nitrate reductase subunit alpha n=1 Tax=Limnobacter sp. TaxID=2003368 RepID=UPI001D400105|nr:nitrate reductase subunit alpha [Limnobacter sp.]MBU0783399.1 nitrate reductase subunit alpha [Gammaproteobacteria bacterium]MBU0850618.1 nitrate reductase subunit alpha [Gammaproteobacteria bacterium]MBU1267791.1 nitrate reductase subunit alpha [Gammaproteobacteria bacterium]MBU1529648.1 nitrate reductase subunit alpha [Gammaproteobacteria bacterium]MBU1780630.1 nitrate reductase subunit alpha [Gammaproteobacteria bacterium]
MSHFLDRLTYFRLPKESFSDEHGRVTGEDRTWEDAYRARWAHDKIVRSTHGVNCTGSCSWKIYVKGGIVTWETQQTDYPRTRWDMPNHEPRGCARGASYSWYLYSANRIKYPMVRARLLQRWRSALQVAATPVDAWALIVEDDVARKDYQQIRGLGGFARSTWDEVNKLIAAANIYTIKRYGPDRIIGFSPIPAMSMVSYAAGSRYLSLIGGVCMSFYDWYCDLPPASPQVWGEQTDVPESADWYNSSYIIAWGSNVPQTRTPDAHFFTEVRYKGTKTVAITPDYSEVAKLSDVWIHPKQGTDAALALAMGHVVFKEFYFKKPSTYFNNYAKRYTDLPLLVLLTEHTLEDGSMVMAPGRYLRAADLADSLNQKNNPEWKTLAWSTDGSVVLPQGSIGFRWGQDANDGADTGKWNLEDKDARNGAPLNLLLSALENSTPDHEIVEVGFPYFGGIQTPNFPSNDQHTDVIRANVPARRITLADGTTTLVSTVFDLQVAQYGIDRGLGSGANSYDQNTPYTPAWAETITGVPQQQIVDIAREFANNADKTQGRSMIIIGAAMNHWYHCDMNYRGVINLLLMCGCVGKSGGGWAHYVGQEKLRPQTGWTALAFALDWSRPPRQQNSTSFFYAHTDQWRYEKLGMDEIVSPLADRAAYSGSMIDFNVRAERMGWLPSAPQLNINPLNLARKAEEAGLSARDYVARGLEEGTFQMSCEDPDSPENWPRNLFVWRSNLLGSSGKGHEYFLKHLLGTQNGVQGKDLGDQDAKPSEVKWHSNAPQGKLDLLVTLDFRMSTTCLYSDIVLPTASWYEKNDLNTSDMHPFIHPLSAAVDPVWESRSDWEIYKGFAKAFSEGCIGHLGVEKDVVLTPLMHDTPAELAQPYGVKEWKKAQCELIPGKTAPQVTVVERDYPNIYKRFTALGPLMDSLGNGGKGIAWKTGTEVEQLGHLNGTVSEPGPTQGRPRIVSDIDACETVLQLAPETNGHVAVKAWEALSKITGREHKHLALFREDEKIRYRDIQAQPRKIISSPTWSGIESETVSYNAGYTNVHELIPWRTLTGRQQFFQDHPWMIAFGEGFCCYRPPVNLKATIGMDSIKPNGHTEIQLNFITSHQKWGIHSTYTDNLLMLTLNRGGPVVWLSEDDARAAEIVDNDWIEMFNTNGAIAARAVVSQRIKPGMLMMYHAQEKIINTPGSEITGTRGGIHNSVTRIVLKPTHMIGGYAQYSYGFNYYGTIGTNRDEFVIVRKMAKIDWLDTPRDDHLAPAFQSFGENP